MGTAPPVPPRKQQPAPVAASTRGAPLPTAAGSARQPAIFVNHGGGPMPIIGTGGKAQNIARGGPGSPMVLHLQSLHKQLPAPPRAVLVATAHWEESSPAITGVEKPDLLYDYYGFPPEAYAPHLTYEPNGEPGVAARACELLKAAGFHGSKVVDRPLDHGTFIPLKLIYPDADVPVVQVSLLQSLDASKHIKMGEALAPLRDEGVLLIGSGQSFHSFSGFGDKSGKAAQFDEWLKKTCASPASFGAGQKRTEALCAWRKAPGGAFSHPREEHLLPLMVCAGAGGDDECTVDFSGDVFGVPVSGFRFG